MNYPVTKHEDNRRVLIEWVKDFPFRSAKIVIAKDKLPLGKHYHQNKDELYYMLKGKMVYVLTTKKRVFRQWLFEGETLFVPRGVGHTFELFKDSILLGAQTEPFDQNDEIPIVD
jgi:oxalate decarboxylase/phosphoglucose isomerase-like protein (cupin superfamily)